MSGLRLGLKFLRGGGRAGLARLALMLAGVAVAVTAALLALAIPQSLNAASARAAARLPQSTAHPADAVFRYTIIEDESKDRPWLQLVVTGARADAAVPSWLPRLPGAGEIFVSPALADLVAGGRADLAPLRIAGEVGAGGLTDPDELFSVRGASGSELPGGGIPASGFGVPVGRAGAVAVSASAVLAEMGLLVGIPAAVYLATCAQLSSATRSRRFAALRLIGVDRRTAAGAAATESAVVGAAGALVGLVAYALVGPAVATSHRFGIRWFAEDAALSPVSALAVVAVAAAVSAVFGRLAVRRALSRPLAARREPEARPASLWALVPLVVGSGLLLPIAVAPLLGDREVSSSAATVVLGAAALAIVGVLSSVRPLTSFVARWLSAHTQSPAVRLAAGRLVLEPAAAFRVLVGLVLLVLVAGIGSAVVQDARLAAGVQGTTALLAVEAGEVPPSERVGVLALDVQAPRIALTRGRENKPVTDPETGMVLRGGRTVTFGTCEDVSALVGAPIRGCTNGAVYRLRGVDEPSSEMPLVEPGTALRIGDYDLRAPEQVLGIPKFFASPLELASVLVTSHAPPGGVWTDETRFVYRVASDDDTVESVRAQVAARAPAATVRLQGRNLEAIVVYRAHRAVVGLGLLLGFLLGLFAFLVAAGDRALERRRQVSALLAIGVPPRTVRTSQVLLLLVPLGIALTIALAVGQLVAMAYLGVSGLQRGWYDGGLGPQVVMALVGTVCAIVAGVAVSARHVRVEDLRRE